MTFPFLNENRHPSMGAPGVRTFRVFSIQWGSRREQQHRLDGDKFTPEQQTELGLPNEEVVTVTVDPNDWGSPIAIFLAQKYGRLIRDFAYEEIFP